MTSQESYGLACMEIWGGNRQAAREVLLPGLAGWIYSEPLPGSLAGGDVYYLSLCSHGELTRVSLADISGHGETVSRAAQCLRGLMQKHINTFDQTEFARELNQSFQEECVCRGFATVVLLGVYGKNGELVFTNAGQPPPLWYHAAKKRWSFLEQTRPRAETEIADLPLGVIPGTDYHEVRVQLQPGDLVLLYSDALSEARNPKGKLLTPEGLRELAGRLPVDSPAAAGQALLEAVGQFRAGRPAGDDQTVVALQRRAG
ncbi:MAG: PP2C family protein-serine/threonine phosphatase [Terriglobia bacterium]